MKQFDTVRATIKYIKPVKKEALPDGYCGLFQAGWIIEDGDFDGDYAMIPATADLWVPSSELIGIQNIPSKEYYNFRKNSGMVSVALSPNKCFNLTHPT